MNTKKQNIGIEEMKAEDKVVVIEKKSGTMKHLVIRFLPFIVVAVVAIILFNIFSNNILSHRKENTRIMIENRFGPVADLITYEDSYSVMETYEDYRTLCGWDIPLTGNAVIVQGEGKITLGFNLENVKPEVDGNVIKVNLPAPEIKSNYLEPMKFIENNNILNPLSAEETNQKFMAEKNYKLKEAIDKGIFEKASENAEIIIQSLYDDLEGYEVKIHIDDPVIPTVEIPEENVA